MAEECQKILLNEYSEDLDDLVFLGGSSGGARPKILTKKDEEEWIIKFPSTHDTKNIGIMEYDYAKCAKKCGVEMSECRLLPSQKCAGYFGTKRFDREHSKRVHMISVSALLETSHRIPNLDYTMLMNLTMKLTNDFEEIMKLYRLMCFNVFAHNRDDHSKNFSFLYDIEQKKWKLSPAYDLIYSNSIGGEHATCVNGNGRNPGMNDVLAVAKKIVIDQKKAENIANEIRHIVKEDLQKYLVTKDEIPLK